MLKIKAKRGFFPDLIRRVLLSWLLAATVEYLLLPAQFRSLDSLRGLAEMSLVRVIVITCIGTMLLSGCRCHRLERWGFAGVFAVLGGTALSASFSWAFAAVCLFLVLIFGVYGVFGWDSAPGPETAGEKPGKVSIWLTAVLAALFFLFVCVWTVGRVYSFSAPTYDFGIFSQMFYHMKESGLPMTTLERDGPLSHFDVHVSPIYYLMLPFYLLVPTPATLQVLQAAVLASAVVPLWLIGKQHGLSGAQRTLLCALLLLYPAFSGGTSYDLHENCFLTPLILWLFLGIDRKSPPITIISAILTLMVKEDAAVYTAVIALWLVVKTLLHYRKETRGELITGLALLAVSLLWFFAVTGYLAESGDGVMTYRYDNFIYDDSGSLVTVIKAVILNPMKAVYECVDSEKLYFIAMTLLPLLGLPLLTRRYERYILLIPYLLVNLMSDYQYQHSIFFQYTFGSTGFLLYLTAVNLADFRANRARIVSLSAAVLVSAVCFGAAVVPKAICFPAACVQNEGEYQNIRETLAQIPAEASVTATTFYTTCLSQREVIYDLKFASTAHLLESEYVVLDVSAENSFRKFASPGQENGFENLVKLLEQNGYTLIDSVDGVLVIYQKK